MVMNQNTQLQTDQVAKSEPNALKNLLQKKLAQAADHLFVGVLGLLVATAVAWVGNVLNRQEIEKARAEVEEATKILKAKSDYDTAFTLMERVSSSRSADHAQERVAYREMLEFLQREVKLNPGLAKTVGEYIASFDRTHMRENNTQALTPELAPAQVQNTKAVISSNISNSDLPARLYIQIANEAQRKTYSEIAQAFQNTEGRVHVPAVEVVGGKAPARTDMRYCPSTDQELAQAVRQQVETVMGPVLLRQLPESLCRTVRKNNMELWLSKGAK
jgi:hypothetical protein